MDKLRTDLYGGWPLELDDLRWVLQGIEKCFTGICNGLGDGFILSGCEMVNIAPNQYTIAPGYVVLAGEIYEYDGATVAVVDPTKLYFQPWISYGSSGLEIFEDGSSQDTYEKRHVTANYVATPPPVAPYAQVMGDRLADRLFAIGSDGWHVVGSAGEPSLLNGWTAAVGRELRFRREPGNLLRLSGRINGASSTSGHMVTVPTGFRPLLSTQRIVIPSATTAVDGSMATVDLYSNGELWVQSSNLLEYDMACCPPFVLL